jgi:hypothetical protein
MMTLLQQGLLSSDCNSAAFQARIIDEISSGGAMICCQTDGCNWNATTAANGWSLAQFTAANGSLPTDGSTTNSSSGKSWILYVVIGVVCALLLLCCCCCLFCFWAGKKEEEEEEEKKEGVVHPRNNKSLTSLPGGLRRTKKGKQVNDFNGGAKHVQVAPTSPEPGIPVFGGRDHERYSAIDRRINKRLVVGHCQLWALACTLSISVAGP